MSDFLLSQFLDDIRIRPDIAATDMRVFGAFARQRGGTPA